MKHAKRNCLDSGRSKAMVVGAVVVWLLFVIAEILIAGTVI